MLIRYAMLAIACFASGVAISGGYFAFISMIGIFPKLLEKVKGVRYYLLIECLLAYGAALPTLLFLPAISALVCKKILGLDQSMSHQIHVLISDDFLSHQAAQYCVLRS